ncbi:hypothetical protein M9Y10_030368 [Tritrichomonas musculus]|uniref:Viral A-type inclusion protein n=1 Tax=Tritrichomonas musculus TaxID=1915356 RepID=A0ABR2H4B3_9EUKA
MTNSRSNSIDSTESDEEVRITDLNNYTHNEIMKIYEHLDSLDKKMASFQKVMSPASIDEIHERLDKIEAQLKLQNEFITNSDINDIKKEIQELKEQTYSNIKTQKEIRCLKYEVRLLKKSNNNNIQVQSRDIPVENTQNEQDTLKLQKQIDSMDNAIRCLKFEVKKLKETPSPEAVPIPTAAPVENSVHPEDIEKLQKDIDSMDNAIKCLKFEVKKLKETPVPAPAPVVQERAVPVIPDDLVQRVDNAQETSTKANDTATDAQQQIAALKSENEELKSDVKCLKYEVKKLKDAPVPESSPVEQAAPVPVVIPDEFIQQIKDANDKSAQACEKADKASQDIDGLKQQNVETTNKVNEIITGHKSMTDDMKCLKYEVKKLKDAPQPEPTPVVEERSAPSIPDDLVQRVDDAQQTSTKANEAVTNAQQQIVALKTENEQLKSDMRCLKYEVKKLKDAPVQEAAPVEQAEPAPIVIPDEFIQQIKDANDKSDKAVEQANKASQDIDGLRQQSTETTSKVNEQFVAIQNDNSKLKSDVKCLKYEVKKLKDAPQPEPVQERAAPAIPDDLEERVDNAQQASAKANDVAVAAGLKADDAHQQIEDLKKENEKLRSDMGCVKYEVKKLKEAPVPDPVQERAAPAIPDDLVERVDNAQQTSARANEGVDDAQKKLEEANKRIDTLMDENEDMKTDIKCLKYEVKRLKNAPALMAAPVEERAVPELPEDIVERVDNAQQTSTKANEAVEDLKKENATLRSDMKCMKYEVKKLKEAPAPEPVQERAAPAIPDDLVERVDNAQQQSTKANDVAVAAGLKADDAHQQIENLKKENEKLRSDISCMKYEVKKLKDAPAPAPVPVEERAIPEIPDDLVERVDNAQQTSTKANDAAVAAGQKADDAHQQIEDLKKENATLRSDMKCMKYEVKKLKEAPAPEPVQERAVPEIPDDLVERVDNAQQTSTKANDAANDANKQIEGLKNENEDMKTDIKCLKYEVKRLKNAPALMAAPVEERAVPELPEDIVERVDNAQQTSTKANEAVEDLKKENATLRSDMKCMKYEVKKLKEAPAPEPVQERAAPAIPDDLVERVDNAQQQSTKANEGVDDAQKKLEAANKRIDDLKNENESLKADMKCMKYEVKKLKDTPAPEPVEQAPQPVVIPDEFIQQIKDANAKSDKAVKDIDAVRADNENIHKDMKCMKYEVKKLKEAPAPEPVQERAAPAIPDDLLERVDNAQQQSTKANEGVDETQKKLDEANKRIDTLKNENESLKADMKCMKYEVKKLKDTPQPEPVQERAAPEIPQDLVERVDKASKDAEDAGNKAGETQKKLDDATKTINKLKKENDSLKEDMKCMKYEVKKLKDAPQPEPVKEQAAPAPATIPDELLTRINKASKRSHHASKHCRQLDQKAGEINEKINAIDRDMKCMKYEIKKLKDAPENEPAQERAAPVTPAIPDDLVERVDKASKQSHHASKVAKDADSKATDLSNKLEQIQADNDKLKAENKKMNDDIKCMKFEVKKLKDTPQQEPAKERAAEPVVIPDEFVQQIKEANDKSDKAIQQANKATKDIEDAQNKAQEANFKVDRLKKDHDTMNEDMKCIKYEVKKLKDTPVVAQERAAPEIPDDLVERIDKVESNSTKASEDAKDAEIKADEAQKKLDDAAKRLDRLKKDNESLKEDMKCMKYEVKKLKENSSKQDEKGNSKRNEKAVLN